jgi:hypothetical protein
MPQYSINDITEHKQSVAKQRSKQQRWLIGGGLVAASLTLAVMAVRNQPERMKPQIQSSGQSSEQILGHTIK